MGLIRVLMLLASRSLGQSRGRLRRGGRGPAIGPSSEARRSTTALKVHFVSSFCGRPLAAKRLFTAVKPETAAPALKAKGAYRRTTTTSSGL